jgi:BCCT family betaine/carnitine transporter
VREFIVCVILIPTVRCILWMATFGGTALSQVITDASAPVGAASQEIKLFHMLADFPLSGLLSLIGIVLVLVFFVTSSDSGSLVIDTITAGGKTDAPVSQRVFWCVFEGLAAAVLLLVGGAEALGALQAMAVSTGLPFTVVLLAMCVSLWIGLSRAAKEL